MCGECAPGWGCVSPQFGRAPLHWASAHGHVDIVRMLLDHGASMVATDRVSQTSCLAAPTSTLHRGSRAQAAADAAWPGEVARWEGDAGNAT